MIYNVYIIDDNFINISKKFAEQLSFHCLTYLPNYQKSFMEEGDVVKVFYIHVSANKVEQSDINEEISSGIKVVKEYINNYVSEEETKNKLKCKLKKIEFDYRYIERPKNYESDEISVVVDNIYNEIDATKNDYPTIIFLDLLLVDNGKETKMIKDFGNEFDEFQNNNRLAEQFIEFRGNESRKILSTQLFKKFQEENINNVVPYSLSMDEMPENWKNLTNIETIVYNRDNVLWSGTISEKFTKLLLKLKEDADGGG